MYIFLLLSISSKTTKSSPQNNGNVTTKVQLSGRQEEEI
ncbi:hypothetical protein POREN0001_0987 [Porphyromonas endodontalis ATCC 35406]|uniref:Uncharacterized protein n=1 Tax=Porphyromonas endodontalis (strain ATCC 35406 / DSM 24491 / JCM 8526 / CCUG 16442 / BCRC 14492 / NCTC 13058 / HG 370) TaxID=553175 RepID=C3J947_POREA|nr:hypothetical protein POREN0001_0987 [Porphyromonas endodontalis ATCC 35406]